jgi:outer membrane lipoprotein-sorting protein
MTNFFEPLTLRMALILCALACVLACLPSIAQETAPATPLSADEVIARVVEMNGVRAKALENYSSIRSYHLECHCLSHKKADMLVRVDYQAPNKKDFTILSESGSASVRNKVFKKLLEAEQESTRPENQQRSAITSDNYTFALVDYQKTNAGDFYVLDAKPRNKNKFLFRGRIWVDGKDFAITQVEGEPAVNPSWWTVKTDFKRSYEKVNDFWLPQSNESTTKVRIFGTAVLTISYGDYQITQVPGERAVPSLVKPSDKPAGGVDAARGRTDTISMIGLKIESEVTGNAVRQ